MGRKYANSPIIEAICDFRFSPDTKWDLTIPGLVYEIVGKEFPNKEQRLVQEVEIAQTPEGMQHQIHINERILFLANDRKTFVQLGPHLLAVNCLKPYPMWKEFRARIKAALSAIGNVVDIGGLQRIGLRYLNRIEIPGRSFDFEDYFEFRPFLGQKLTQDMVSFILGCVLPFYEGRDSCRVQLTNAARGSPDSTAVLLDLEYSLAKPKAISPPQVLEWVETAHEKVEDIFEGCISERLREIFKEVK